MSEISVIIILELNFDAMIDLLTYISLITGGLLVLLLLLSLLGGLELDFDLGGTELETDGGGGLGIVKSVLTFFSVGAWVVRLILATSDNPALAFTIGIISGFVAVFFLSFLFKILLKQESNVNWKPMDAMYKNAEVYLKIPKKGEGIIKVEINGVYRELKARSKYGKDIATGAKVIIEDIDNGFALVNPIK